MATYEKRFERSLEQLTEQVDEAKRTIFEEIKQKAGDVGEIESNRIKQFVLEQIEKITGSVENTRESGEDFALSANKSAIQVLASKGIRSIVAGHGIDQAAFDEEIVKRVAERLRKRGVLKPDPDGAVQSPKDS